MDLIRLAFSNKYNTRELDYKETIQSKEEDYLNFDKFKVRILDGRIDYLHRIIEQVSFKGRILEIGAGSSWFSCELSKLKDVTEVYCLDFSERMMLDIVPQMCDFLKADTSKIVRVVGDFYNLDFAEGYFDMVVVDAALHHAEDLVGLLNGVFRVLNKEGVLVAIREPIVPLFRQGSRDSFGKHERELGVTEKIYDKIEWKTYFDEAGFNLKFLSIIPNSNFKQSLMCMRPFAFFNGYLFAHYVFVANKSL